MKLMFLYNESISYHCLLFVMYIHIYFQLKKNKVEGLKPHNKKWFYLKTVIYKVNNILEQILDVGFNLYLGDEQRSDRFNC